MERSKNDGVIGTSETINGFGFTHSSSINQQPDYTSKAVQDALRHLASIDLIGLCNEAKVEKCRASRDLRSCGRIVESVLSSCGHASLCAECSQRCDSCPICRTLLLKSGNVLRRRLYNECIEAGLISKSSVDRSLEKEDDEAHLTADVGHLYSLFDVAMENNLCCLICHYVSDVCMDETAVSSDPVTAFLLDEVVVKDWCKRTFKNIIDEARGIYNLETYEMSAKMGQLAQNLGKLVGLSNVLEVLDLSFKDTQSAKLDDLHHLQESVLKTKQHMELMMWCIRHQFLENTRSRHTNIFSWRALLRERENAAAVRAWPEVADHSGASTGEDNSSLFIEEALLNLEVEQGYKHGSAVDLEVASLRKDGGQSFLTSKVEGLGGCYPFGTVRTAVDTLFLCGSSDMVVSKQAIFLYYLFDRHWTISDEEWRNVVDDLASTFSITKHSLLESLTFYLLDDHTDEALQEACKLLPEISSPESHPKIAKVLLERGNPDSALMFLRWSGHDSSPEMSLGEAVTAIRVRIECGLLTEAFMYQRMLCTRVKENQTKHKLPVEASDNVREDIRSWTDWVHVLVTEICCLCIRRSLLDRMLELPWNHDEERHLHKCLLDCATVEPYSTAGSLLVVYYLQRHRYIDAYHIDRKLQTMEQDFISKNDVDEEVLHRMDSSAQWRAALVNRSLELLPEVEQQQLKAGKLIEGVELYGTEVDDQCEVDKSVERGLGATGPSASSSSSLQTSVIFQMEHEPSYGPFQGVHITDNQSEAVNVVPPSLSRGDIFKNSGRLSNPPFSNARNINVDDMSTPRTYSSRSSTVNDVYKTASRLFQNDLPDEAVNFVLPSLSPGDIFRNSGRLSKPPLSNARKFNIDDMSTPRTYSTRSSTVNDVYKTASRLFQNDLPDDLVDEDFSQAEQNGLYGQFPKVSPPSSRRVMAKPTRPPSSNRGLVDDSPQEYKTATGKRLSSEDHDEPWNMVSSDAMDVSWSQEANGSPSKFAIGGAQRWRSDETSDDEDQPRVLKLSGVSSHPMLVRRGARRSRGLRK